jgi:hypothetical protein
MPDHSQGILHGQQDKARCGAQWLCMQTRSLPLCSKVTLLQSLLKSYRQTKLVSTSQLATEGTTFR